MYLRLVNFIDRAITSEFERRLQPNKVLLILGARRVGKTQFLKRYIERQTDKAILTLNGEDVNDVALLQERSVKNYRSLLENIDMLVIDEAQAIDHIGLILKLIVDEVDGMTVVVTGSSMFDLSNKLGEPLVGRKHTMFLFPLAQLELNEVENRKETNDNLTMRLLYGSYPEVEFIRAVEDKQAYLFEMVNDYLLKDILTYQEIKKSAKIYDLLRLIAYQVGSEVSLNELGNQLQVSKNTVESYLDLLTKVFVLYKVEGFSKNLRKEVTKSSKWYFVDNGIRNAIINDFSPIHLRNDIGMLWENYLVTERIKKQHYQRIRRRNHFWRTYDQQEIDWIEEAADKLDAFEFTWSAQKKKKTPPAFSKAYPDAEFTVISKNNYLPFIT